MDSSKAPESTTTTVAEELPPIYDLTTVRPDRVLSPEEWADVLKSTRLHKQEIFSIDPLTVSKAGQIPYKAIFPTLKTRSKKGKRGYPSIIFGTKDRPMVSSFGLGDGIDSREKGDKRPSQQAWIESGKELKTKRAMSCDVSMNAKVLAFFEELHLLQKRLVTEEVTQYCNAFKKKMVPSFISPGRVKNEDADDDPEGVQILRLICLMNDPDPKSKRGNKSIKCTFYKVNTWTADDKPDEVIEIKDKESLVGKEIRFIAKAKLAEISNAPDAFKPKISAYAVYILDCEGKDDAPDSGDDDDDDVEGQGDVDDEDDDSPTRGKKRQHDEGKEQEETSMPAEKKHLVVQQEGAQEAPPSVVQ